MKWFLVMIALGFCLLPLAAEAQFQFGGGVRASFLNFDKSELDTSSVFWGVHGRVRVMKFVGGEISYQKREDNWHIHNGDLTLTTKPLQISAIVYPLAMLPVTPYVLAGTGWYYFTLGVTGDLGLPYLAGEGTIDITQRANHVGVGVEAFIGSHVSVGADVRKIYLTLESPIALPVIVKELKLNAYLVNITGTFYF